MRIYTRTEWGARYDDGAGPAPLPAREVWLHHAGPGRELTAAASLDDEKADMRHDEAVGEQRFGKGISYTWVVFPSGRVFEGHSIGREGTHTRGRNSISRAIKFPGDYRYTVPTAAQIEATAHLLAHGKRQGWWVEARIDGGHRDAPGASTECPGDNAAEAIAAINARAAELLAPKPAPQEDAMPEICRSIETNTLWAVNAVGRVALEGEGDTKALDVAAFYVGMGWAKWGPNGKPRDVAKAILEGVPRTDVP